MANFYILEQVNLFCGESSQGKHLTLQEMKVPTLSESENDHTPGGGRVAVGIASVIEKLECTFKLTGSDPELLSMFGLGKRNRQTFTALGAVRDKSTGGLIEAKSVIEARLGKIEGDGFKRSDLHGHDYALIEVWHYELYFNGEEKFFFDFMTNTLRIDGVDPDGGDLNRILQING